jgi:hypothetical protein
LTDILANRGEKTMAKPLAAEFLGTFWLVFGGCGSAVFAAAFPQLGIGFTGVALAFGLTVVTMAYAVGPISGGHFNPAVSLGLWAGGRFPTDRLLPYWVAQLLGAFAAAAVLYVIAAGKPGFDVVASGFAANGYGDHSPGGYPMASAFLAEAVLTSGADPSDLDPDHQHVGKPGPVDQPGLVRWRLGHGSALAVLACAAPGRAPRRRPNPLARQRRLKPASLG